MIPSNTSVDRTCVIVFNCLEDGEHVVNFMINTSIGFTLKKQCGTIKTDPLQIVA